MYNIIIRYSNLDIHWLMFHGVGCHISPCARILYGQHANIYEVVIITLHYF